MYHIVYLGENDSSTQFSSSSLYYVAPTQMVNYVIREDDLNFSNDKNNESMTDIPKTRVYRVDVFF